MSDVSVPTSKKLTFHGGTFSILSVMLFLLAGSCLGDPASVQRTNTPRGNDSAATNSYAGSPVGSRRVPSKKQPLVLPLASNVVLELVWIPAGEFTMGSDACAAERPPHKVNLTKGFWIGKCEVTQEQYQSVTGKNPSRFERAKYPVDSVSWSNAIEFATLLTSRLPEYGVFRLPTEAEWEYACDANCPFGWHSESSGMRVHPAGESKANARELFDMLGNVSEWCQDWYELEYYKTSPSDDPTGPIVGRTRVVRGGCYLDEWESCTPRARNRAAPGNREGTTGFRVVLTETQTKEEEK